MAVYVGLRCKGVCGIHRIGDGKCSPLPPRLDIRRHSLTGFEWGYNGSGPAQTALALLIDVTGDVDSALALYQRFKFQVVGTLPTEGWVLPGEVIETWITGLIGRSFWPTEEEVTEDSPCK